MTATGLEPDLSGPVPVGLVKAPESHQGRLPADPHLRDSESSASNSTLCELTQQWEGHDRACSQVTAPEEENRVASVHRESFSPVYIAPQIRTVAKKQFWGHYSNN